MSIVRKPTCRILLVEDQVEHQDLILRHLRNNAYYSVESRTSAFASESLALLQQEEFDVLLLDLSLPDSGPEDTLREFTEKFPHLPIIVLTSLIDPKLIENAIDWGAQDFLDKGQLNSEIVARSIRYSIQRKQTLNHLAQQNEALRTFSHTVAHEIKSPLQSVTIALHLLNEIVDLDKDEKLRKLMRLGIESTEYLTSLVGELLEFAKYEHEASKDVPVELSSVIQEVVRDLQSSHDFDDVVIDTSEALPVVLGSRMQIARVFSNLIENAVKYRSKETLVVRVRAKSSQDGWLISVEDNGRGIAEKYQKKIFQLLYRVKSNDDVGGTGIGLSFTRQIVERHGGKIWVESKLGEGSTFYVLFHQ